MPVLGAVAQFGRTLDAVCEARTGIRTQLLRGQEGTHV